ncbi:site-specific integrase, partial [Synechococcus sp. AH-603-M21]|nr:site-specific integrase [Synechococcus sp. AH-603-M21]
MPDGNILDKRGIPTDKNAYVYRRADKGGRWYLYFYDKESGKRHRFALKTQSDDIPEPTPAGSEKAWMLGVEKFIELKGKSERGESVRGLKFGDMVDKFLAKEHKKISRTPHTGISEARFRLLKTQLRWMSEFVGDTRKEIHKIRRNTFLNYEVWRKERAIQYGKDTPQSTTINQEISTLRRAFNEVALAEGFIKRDSIPELPSVKLPKDKKHRRDDLTENEWLELERCCRLYW